MNRPSTPRRGTEPEVPPADPGLLALDLPLWAGERTAHGGRRDALLGRVEALHLSLDGRRIEARVRGNRPLPYSVEVWLGDGATPRARCTCSFDSPAPCRHAVAALETLRFPAPRRRRTPGRARGRPRRARGRVIQPAPPAAGFVVVGDAVRTLSRQERIAAARADELALRRKAAGRHRTPILPLAGAAAAPPRFELAGRKGEAGHVVTLRGPAADAPSCTCRDFVENELGTCVHVERLQARRRRGGLVLRAPDPLLSLWASPRAWTEHAPDALREVRVGVPGCPVPPELGAAFDADGWILAPPNGRRQSDWLRAAHAATAGLAERSGLPLDVDPAVEERLSRLAADEARLAALGRVDREPGIWAGVRDRLGFTLHPYQEDGARFLARSGRAFLADDMGLGKTVQAIAAALVLREIAGARRVLVVCPASLKHQWAREIEHACGERAVLVEGARARRLQDYRDWADGFLLVNYELVLRDLDALRAASAHVVILDEAQRIKNWETKTARAVKRLDSPHAFVLTGTPLENRLLELHSLVEFLHPRALGPRWRLLPFHSVSDGDGRIVAYEGLDVLRGRLRELFLRRERRDVLDQLPDRTDNTFWIEMTGRQRAEYRRHAAAVAALLRRGRVLSGPEVRAVLRAMTNMRILCNAEAQYRFEEHEARIDRPDPATPSEVRGLHSPKLEEFARVLEDLLDDAPRKIVVFSQWARMLRLAEFTVRTCLRDRDLRAELFHGGLSLAARQQLLDAFAHDPEFRVLFSTDAGGLGLNLQPASIVIHLEVPWNPAVLEQRVGRVHRMGQRHSVQVLHFVTRGAIEERVRQVVEDKRALFQGLLSENLDRVVLGAGERWRFLEQVRSLLDAERGA